jgi:hypothetical protein
MKRVFTSVFLIGEFSQKNQPEECDFDQYKGFLTGKNGPNSPNFKKKTFKLPDFYNKFQ